MTINTNIASCDYYSVLKPIDKTNKDSTGACPTDKTNNLTMANTAATSIQTKVWTDEEYAEASRKMFGSGQRICGVDYGPFLAETRRRSALEEPERVNLLSFVMQDFSTERAWTIEEDAAATRMIHFLILHTIPHDDENEARINEIRRRGATAERSNQFEFIMQDYLLGIVGDGFGPRVYTGHDDNVLFKLAVAFSAEREGIMKNFGGFLTDEEVNGRLWRLHEQFDAAFQQLAQKMQDMANRLPSRSFIFEDIITYGQLIKDFISNGNPVLRNDNPASLYRYLSNNKNTQLSIDDINRIGRAGHRNIYSGTHWG
jgi:hypothetical protein